MNNSDLIKSAKEAVRNGTVLTKGVVDLLCDALSKSDAQLHHAVAENAALKDEISNITFMRDDDYFGSTRKAQEIMGRLVNIGTPATDAAIASLRAEGVEMAIEVARPLIASEFQYSDFDACVSATYKFPESDLVGKVEMVEWMKDFAAQLRSQSAPSPASPAPLSAAITDIIAERQRQQSAEGWTPEHDDKHINGEMAFAAASYAFHAAAAMWDLEDCGTEYDSHPAPKNWPWEPEWWKPTTQRRDLVKAGALIAAEIERIDRAASKSEQVKGVQS